MIAIGVEEDENHEQGAGDQGMIYGYACNETPEFMPYSLILAHDITRKVDKLSKTKYPHLFGPDGKYQVSVNYVNGIPIIINAIIISV